MAEGCQEWPGLGVGRTTRRRRHLLRGLALAAGLGFAAGVAQEVPSSDEPGRARKIAAEALKVDASALRLLGQTTTITGVSFEFGRRVGQRADCVVSMPGGGLVDVRLVHPWQGPVRPAKGHGLTENQAREAATAFVQDVLKIQLESWRPWRVWSGSPDPEQRTLYWRAVAGEVFTLGRLSVTVDCDTGKIVAFSRDEPKLSISTRAAVARDEAVASAVTALNDPREAWPRRLPNGPRVWTVRDCELAVVFDEADAPGVPPRQLLQWVMTLATTSAGRGLVANVAVDAVHAGAAVEATVHADPAEAEAEVLPDWPPAEAIISRGTLYGQLGVTRIPVAVQRVLAAPWRPSPTAALYRASVPGIDGLATYVAYSVQGVAVTLRFDSRLATMGIRLASTRREPPFAVAADHRPPAALSELLSEVLAPDLLRDPEDADAAVRRFRRTAEKVRTANGSVLEVYAFRGREREVRAWTTQRNGQLLLELETSCPGP